MAKEKKKSPITPARPCIYAFLKQPDTRWKKTGEYKVSLVFDQDDEFIAKVEAKAKKEFKLAKENMKPDLAKLAEYNSPVKPELDTEKNETGNVILAFKSNAQYQDKKTEEIVQVVMKVFDAQGNRIKNLPNIGNGSKLAISFNPVSSVIVSEHKKLGTEVNCYLSLWMNAVQLLELVEFNPDGTSYGFGKEEGGYDAGDQEEDGENSFTSPDSTSDTVVDPDEF